VFLSVSAADWGLNVLKFHNNIAGFCQFVKSIFGVLSVIELAAICLVWQVLVGKTEFIETNFIQFSEPGYKEIFFCKLGCAHRLSFL
jgi:hypothetical protein